MEHLYSYASFLTRPSISPDDSSKNESLKLLDLVDYIYILRPSLGQKEGNEFERVMYFYPDTYPSQSQTDVTGIAQAIVNFTANLGNEIDRKNVSIYDTPTSISYDHRYILSNNSRQVVITIESGKFFFGISFNKKICREHDYFPHVPTIKSFLVNAYETNRLFYGLMESQFLNSKNSAVFKQRLRNFFDPYFSMLKIGRMPLVDLLTGVDFMPLSPVDFLNIDCLMTRCVRNFISIKFYLFFYQEKIILYNVDKAVLVPIYNLFIQSLLPLALQAELQPECIDRMSSGSEDDVKSGYFLKDVVDFLGENSENNFPKIFIPDFSRNNETKCYELVSYRKLNATVCFLTEFPKDEKSSDDIEKISEFLDKSISELDSKLGESPDPNKPISDSSYHFIYFNPDSMSMCTSFLSSILPRVSTASLPPPNIYSLIYDTYDRFIDSSSEITETFIKSDGDWWIVFKRIDGRILVLFLHQSAQSTLTDVNTEVENIIHNCFRNIFLNKINI